MVASISALFQVGDLRTFISAILILYQDILSILSSRHCPRGYPHVAIGRPGRNFCSRAVLHSNTLLQAPKIPPTNRNQCHIQMQRHSHVPLLQHYRPLKFEKANAAIPGGLAGFRWD
jgi:hypothetical protein